MNREELQKKYVQGVLLYVLSVFLLFTFIIVGVVFIDEGSIILGIALLFTGLIFSIITYIYALKKTKKYKPLMYKAFSDEIKATLNKRHQKVNFNSRENNVVLFKDDYLQIDELEYKYDTLEFGIFLVHKPKMLSDKLDLVLGIFSEEMEVTIEFDGDLLDVIENKKINVFNQEDFNYFLENTEVCAKKLIRIASFSHNVGYIPLVFSKTKEEKKQERKFNFKKMLIQILIFLGIFGFSILLTWLASSKEGIKISDSFAYNLGFKIVFSVVLLSLGFIKSKNIRFIGKSAFILYLVMYWYGILFLNARINVLKDIIFLFIFVIIGIIVLDKKDLNKNPINRLIGFGIFLMLMLLFTANDYNTVESESVFAIFGIIGAVLMIPGFILTWLYYKKKAKIEEVKKSVVITAVIFYPLGIVVMFIACLSFIFINLNYSLDRSTPVIMEEEIVELKQGGENESDVAIVIINEEEVEVPISRSLYFDLEIGDIIEVGFYPGAFNYEYYIIEGVKQK